MGCLKLSAYEEINRDQGWASPLRVVGVASNLNGNHPGESTGRIIRLKSGYPFGDMGMRMDNEFTGNEGDDYGAEHWELDSRLPLRLNPDPVKDPSTGSYVILHDNPMLNVDPLGNTDYWFNGRWIGTDGAKNNLIGVVTSRKLMRDISNTTRSGQNYSVDGIQNGFSNGKLFAVNHDVLKEANAVLDASIKGGEKTEFDVSMKKNGDDNYSETGPIQEGNEQHGAPLLSGDVSIHSHTGTSGIIDGRLYWHDASQPSNDENSPGLFNDKDDVFPKFNMNIIVGKNGATQAETQINPQTHHEEATGQVIDNRVHAINIFDRFSKLIGTVSKSEAQDILNNDRGNLGKIYDKKNNNSSSR